VETWAVVVAAGRGTRFGRLKQFEMLGGRRVLERALAPARQCCDGVVLVVPPGTDLDGPLDGELGVLADSVVTGGSTRSDSVRNGLGAVPSTAEVIVVHDAARPLASTHLWSLVIAAVVAGADAAVPAVPVTDTVKQIRPDGAW